MQSTPAQVEKYLQGADYPLSKDELLTVASEEGAPSDVLRDLESLPEQDFASPVEVTKAFAGSTSSQ